MFKTLTFSCLAMAIAHVAVAAPSSSAPVMQDGLEAQAAKADEDYKAVGLAPTKEDLKHAREERAHGVRPPRNNDTTTEIKAVRDNNNRVTSYVVTPGSTKIPYEMENRAERPVDTTPGASSSGTLGTPKFIKFGW